MKGFKGFNKGLTCQPVGNKPAYQFKEGEIAETEEAIVPCHSGFHFCEMPLDVFDYYPPKIGTEYAEVEALGDVQTQDNKCVTNKIMVGRKIGISGMFKAHFALLLEKVSESKEKVITSEDYTHANTSGEMSHANTSGGWSHANTSGNDAHASTSGENSIAASIGIQSKAKADKGAIVISDWRAIDGKWVLVNVYSAMVGKKIKGKTIKAGVWYWFENGELKQEAGE